LSEICAVAICINFGFQVQHWAATIENDEVVPDRRRIVTELANRGVSILPDIVSVLDYPDSRFRIIVAEALGEIGPKAATAVPRLIREAARVWETVIAEERRWDESGRPNLVLG